MKLSELRTEITERFGAVDTRFGAIDGRFDAMDARFGAIERRLDAMDARFGAIEVRLDAVEKRITVEAMETRRHFDVVAEALRSDFALLAGGVAAIGEKLDRLSREHEANKFVFVGALDDHELRLRILERQRH